MSKYVIITDTGSDLEKELRDKYDIDYLKMHVIIDGEDHEASLDWEEFSAREYYDFMRNGKRITSAQVNIEAYKERFTEYLEKGYDILSLSTSSQISAGVNSSIKAKAELESQYPDRKIICVDCLRTNYALGLLAIRASELRAEGKTIEECAQWIEDNKQTVHMEGTVENLKWLRQAGRVTATSAFFAGILNIKPIIISDAKGRNFAVEKIKGRRATMVRMAERLKEAITDVPYQRIFVSHADCIDDANEFIAIVKEKIGDVDIHVGYVGPGVGSAVGPGMLSINYWGKEVTLNKD